VNQKYKLVPFAKDEVLSGLTLDAHVECQGGRLKIEYFCEGAGDKVLFSPKEKAPKRKDELYKKTCFEFFLRAENGHYMEWNFSPSQEWCSFFFKGYRDRVQEKDLERLAPEDITFVAKGKKVSLSAEIDLQYFFDNFFKAETKFSMALTAVIQKKDGICGYWALKHSNPIKADFHHPQSFVDSPF